MKSVLRNFQNYSIKSKLMIYVLVFGIAIVVVTGLLMDWAYSSAVETSYFESTKRAVGQVNTSLDSTILSYENAIDIISRNPQVLAYLRKKSADSEQTALLESNIRSFLAGFEEYYYGIESLSIVGADNSLISNKMTRKNKIITDDEWYLHSVGNPGILMIDDRILNRNLLSSEKISSDDYFTISKAIIDPSTNQPIGAVIVDLSKTILGNMIKDMQLGKEGFVYIVDSRGVVVYSPVNTVVSRINSSWFTGDRTFIKSIGGQSYQFLYTSSFYTKWKIIGVLSNNQTLKEVANMRLYLLVILAIVCVLSVPTTLGIASTIANPIQKLRRLMKKVESGDLSVRFDAKYGDEIGDLGRSFNSMVLEIQNLLEEIHRENQSKRKAELRILQSQIKPHFLYNTLDTIHWMSKKYKADDIIEVINALTKLFRISLSRGSEVIPLAEEIEHVKSYLIIQKTRYSDILDYEIAIEGEIKELLVQKLILQPIVENAIYHGVKSMKRKGLITVTAAIEDGDLLISVKDNGAGMSRMQVEELNRMLSGESKAKIGYGLYNVNERIRLTYGERYHISVASEPNEGTQVLIRHPMITPERGENHV